MRFTPLALLACFVLSGCLGTKAREQQAQATADMAASIFEAAVAIENGVDPAAPLSAIKSGAAAIISVQDHTYAPADAWAAQGQAGATPAKATP